MLERGAGLADARSESQGNRALSKQERQFCAYEGEAWIGFRNNTRLPWLGWLKPGFRHCFALLPCPGGWLAYDPLSHRTRIDLMPGGYEILDRLDAQGCLLIPARLREPSLASLPWRPFTCVEAVKRALGFRADWVLTPWQLYRALTAAHKNSQT